jgi:hypothetical protein
MTRGKETVYELVEKGNLYSSNYRLYFSEFFGNFRNFMNMKILKSRILCQDFIHLKILNLNFVS